MTQERVLALMNQILVRQGKTPTGDHGHSLRELSFRSLDFSELALRVEKEIGQELNFDASRLRAIVRVSDVLEFFEKAAQRA